MYVYIYIYMYVSVYVIYDINSINSTQQIRPPVPPNHHPRQSHRHRYRDRHRERCKDLVQDSAGQPSLKQDVPWLRVLCHPAESPEGL